MVSKNRRWTGLVALAALLAGTTLLSGCFYPYHHGHHRGGWSRYDGDHHRGDHRRHDRDGRRHGDRDCRRGERCWH
jgi:hypothetical protein